MVTLYQLYRSNGAKEHSAFITLIQPKQLQTLPQETLPHLALSFLVLLDFSGFDEIHEGAIKISMYLERCLRFINIMLNSSTLLFLDGKRQTCCDIRD